MISLYDYLGYAAGKNLGAEATKAATSMGIKLETRYVSNSVYTGDVMLYPQSFLEMFFKSRNNG